LEAAEREVVCGDLQECGVTGARALRELVGLTARRHGQLWTHSQPWLALAGLAVPVGMILSVVSRYWAASSAISGWLYVNNWTWGYLASPGARLDLARTIGSHGASFVALAVWAWTTGFALGSLSRRTVWMNGALFCVIVFGGTLGTTTTGLLNPFNAAIFSDWVYRAALPVIVRAALVVLPALWGMRKALQVTVLSVRQAAVCAAMVVVMTALTARGLEGSLLYGWVPLSGWPPAPGWLGQWRGSWSLAVFPLVMVWPAAYLLMSALKAEHRLAHYRF
jgi:hypothetical protein